mgnify:CR=1 FL=1
MLKSCSKCGHIHEWGVCPKDKPVYYRRRKTKIAKFRSSAIWQRKSKEIIDRDKHLCKLCLKEGRLTMRSLSVHHIIPISENDDLKLEDDNLITLCQRCHREVEGDSKRLAELQELAKIPPEVLLKPGR